MTKGGHPRSGPPPDPTSGRSDARGLSFTALPAAGYAGDVPPFPLPKRPILNEYFEGTGRNRERKVERDEGATESTWERELDLWAWAWSTPQAEAWARDPWRWTSVAMWVRTFVVCEGSEATAADKGSLHRFADDIGLTPAGLRVNGWTIAHDEVSQKRGAESQAVTSSRDRMRVVKAGGA